MNRPQGFQLLLLFSFCFFHSSSSSKTSIVFGTLGRSRYTFDIFTLPIPPLPSSSSSSTDQIELRITDGESVNFNGFFPTESSSLLSLLALPPLDSPLPVETLVYVTERNGSSNIYLDVYPSPVAGIRSGNSSGGGGRRRVALQVPSRIQLPLLRTDRDGVGRVSMKDRPTVSGEYLIYVSTHEESRVPRKSWAAVYSTHIPTGVTRRLTPPGIADFSPAVTPSGEWTAVASSGEKGWTGEVQDLETGIFVFRTVDGSERKEVVGHGGWPCWADDSTLYFHRQESKDGWWSIYRATIRTLSAVSVERVTPPGFHAFTPAAGRGFIAMATRRSTSQFRHIELLDLERNVFVEVTRTISPHFHHFNPFFSPDSSRIGYHRCRGDSNSGRSSGPLILENVRGPISQISLFRIDGGFPSFSSDGRRIAHVGLPGLYVLNSDGSEWREIFSGNAFPTAWDWKRKGVIYTSHGPDFAPESAQVDVISITLQDEEEEGDPTIKKLTIGGENNAFPSPSPDGKWLVLRSGRSGHKNLYIIDAVEGERAGLHRLTNGPWTDTMCNWSPDGDWIAFASDRDSPGSGSFALYVIHPNGTGLRKVVQSGNGGRVNHPSFSPDSKSIVFTSDYAAVSAEPISNPHHYQPYGEIFTANIDGSNIQRLTHNSYEDGTPAWGPTFMKPADVLAPIPSIVRCKFDDCHWLSEQGRISAHSRCAK